MRLSILHDMMREFNYRVAYGSECVAWQDFVNDCHQTYGLAPWDVCAQGVEVDEDFAEYWVPVSRADIDGATADYDNAGWFIG